MCPLPYKSAEFCFGCRIKLSHESAVIACTLPSVAERRGLLFAASELNANERLVKDNDLETVDHGLLLLEGARLRECIKSIDADIQEKMREV